MTLAHDTANQSSDTTDARTELSLPASSATATPDVPHAASPPPSVPHEHSSPEVLSQQQQREESSPNTNRTSTPAGQRNDPDVVITGDIPAITVPAGPSSRTRSTTDAANTEQKKRRRRELQQAATLCLQQSVRFRPDGERIPDGYISLTIRDINDNTVDFNLRPLNPLGDIFKMFLCHVHMRRSDVRFMFDNIRLTDIHTPAELGMRSCDSIDCFWAVTGGKRRSLPFTSHFKFY